MNTNQKTKHTNQDKSSSRPSFQEKKPIKISNQRQNMRFMGKTLPFNLVPFSENFSEET